MIQKTNVSRFGEHLLAKRDINQGEAIVIEEDDPYLKAQRENAEQFLKYLRDKQASQATRRRVYYGFDLAQFKDEDELRLVLNDMFDQMSKLF